MAKPKKKKGAPAGAMTTQKAKSKPAPKAAKERPANRKGTYSRRDMTAEP